MLRKPSIPGVDLVVLLTLAAPVLLGSWGCSRATDASAPAGFKAVPPRELPADFPSGKAYFVRVPLPEDWRRLSRPLGSFAQVRKWGPFMDLRHADLNRLDLTESSPRLLDAFFDSETKWPDVLPAGFDPGEILDLNRNPGLGLRAVHAAGVTGTGVSVAVIDTPLLLDHDEYAGRLRYYGEVNARGVLANFHGCLVTSILAGKTCGVAPGAEVYYVGSHNYDIADESGAPNAKHYARAVDLLLEVNARLPREKRIRVISISAGCGPRNPGFKAMNRAIRKAAEAGIFVVSGNIIDSFGTGLWIWGFDRRSTEDPDDPSSGRVQAWKEWISQVAGGDRFDLYYAHKLKGTKPAEFLVLPEGSKTVAQAGGRAEYGFYPIGGWSSIFPYVAGLYALACQVKPDITPEVFWRIALATGDPVPVEGDGARYAGKRVNPARLIAALHAPN